MTFGQGLLTSGGDLHRRQRRLVQPAFHAHRLVAYARDAVRMASERSAQWHDGAQVDLADEMSSLTLEFVGRTLFGTDVRDEVAIVADATQHLLEDFPTLMSPRGMLTARIPTPFRRRLRREIARLDGVVGRVIAGRGTTGDTGDVVSMLLAVRDEETGNAHAPPAGAGRGPHAAPDGARDDGGGAVVGLVRAVADACRPGRRSTPSS